MPRPKPDRTGRSAAKRRKSPAAEAPPAHSETFDAEYYARFYGDPRTQVTDAETTESLARFVLAYLGHLDLEVRSALDLGCGLGWWRAPLAAAGCDDYTGVELSDYLVGKYGWKKGSVVDFRGPRGKQYDLVVCQGVLQYLTRDTAREAIANLARLSRRALYLEALTTADWRDNCDTERTDGAVHLRSGRWYRRLLDPHFIACGGGLFVKRDSGVVLFELEKA